MTVLLDSKDFMSYGTFSASSEEIEPEHATVESSFASFRLGERTSNQQYTIANCPRSHAHRR